MQPLVEWGRVLGTDDQSKAATLDAALVGFSHLICNKRLFLDGASGLRVGELLGLKWEDVDFERDVIHIKRSIVKQRIGPPKTEASQKPIPLSTELAKSLRLWKMKTTYNRPDDWVYASPKMNGTQPYWPNSIFRVYIKPAAKKIGLTKRIGWHTFRHTFGTILNANGENRKSFRNCCVTFPSKSRWT